MTPSTATSCDPHISLEIPCVTYCEPRCAGSAASCCTASMQTCNKCGLLTVGAPASLPCLAQHAQMLLYTGSFFFVFCSHASHTHACMMLLTHNTDANCTHATPLSCAANTPPVALFLCTGAHPPHSCNQKDCRCTTSRPLQFTAPAPTMINA